MLSIPSAPPIEFSDRFTNWRREAYLLALIASGHSIAVEVVERAARHFDLSSQSGSLKAALDRLHRRGFITSRVLTMYLGGGGRARAALRVVGLTDTGRDCAQACGWRAYPSEWEQLVRYHEAERYPEHALAILLFIREARWRGAAICQVGQELFGHYRPDVLYDHNADGYREYIEVERGGGSPEKWLANYEANAREFSQVNVVALNPQKRRAFVRDIRGRDLGGRATDLRTLLYRRGQTELWLEEWEE